MGLLKREQIRQLSKAKIIKDVKDIHDHIREIYGTNL